MMLYFVLLAFLFSRVAMSVDVYGNVNHNLADVDTNSMLPSSSSQPSSNDEERVTHHQTKTWTEDQRRKHRQTIAERRRAVSLGLAPKVKGRAWTAEQREKYIRTIATREKTDEMQANWSDGRRRGSENYRQKKALGMISEEKAVEQTSAMREKTDATSMSSRFSGKKHSDETKFFIAMRKLGVGRLPDQEMKKARRPPRSSVRCTKRKGHACTDAAREAMSVAAKARWAKVRANQRQAAGEASTSELI